MIVTPQCRPLAKVLPCKPSNPVRCQAIAQGTDARKVIQEAQSSLIKVNESRLKALAELRAAKERINQLEEQLAAINGATHQDASASSLQQPSSSSSQGDSKPHTTIVYGTGWEQVYVHFKTPSRDWTPIPGKPMVKDEYLQGCKVATFDTTERIEFVLNNGANDWDSPSLSGAQNYVIEGPGTWHLKSGKLQKLG